MVRAVAAQAGRGQGVNVRVAQAGAERLPFADASFDFVLCGHAIFYFPAAAAEFHRVLRPEGRIGLSIVERECHRWLWEAWAAHVRSDPDPSEDDPEGAATNSPDGLGAALEEAGFREVRVVAEATALVYTSKSEWWATLWALGTRHALEKMSSAALRALRGDLFARLEGFSQADGVHIPYQILYGLGRKPRAK
jgi:SAM-dependent methyltransferase